MNGKNIKMLLNAIGVYSSGIGFKPVRTVSELNKQPTECVLKIIQLPENEWREYI